MRSRTDQCRQTEVKKRRDNEIKSINFSFIILISDSKKLEQFRQKIYQLLGPAKDATFELMDAVLLTRKPYSFAELSLSPVFRRKWCSLYEALEKIIIFNREVLYK